MPTSEPRPLREICSRSSTKRVMRSFDTGGSAMVLFLEVFLQDCFLSVLRD